MIAPLHPASIPADLLSKECDIEFVRRSGPGGQHRNKVSTAVVLTHRPTGIRAEANERRSQAENRSVALFRLRVLLAIDVRMVRPKDDPDARLWQSRLVGGRIEISPSHDDFPTLLAWALDIMAENDFDPKSAAGILECSASQLIKFLAKEPKALAMVNRHRTERGHHNLHA